MSDRVLLDDWHPVAATAELARNVPLATRLLGRELALWRSDSGLLQAWEAMDEHVPIDKQKVEDAPYAAEILRLDLKLILVSFWITFNGQWERRDRFGRPRPVESPNRASGPLVE